MGYKWRPKNYGVWGTATSALAASNTKGGTEYITDMLNLMAQENVHWQFYFLNKIVQIDCCYDNPTTIINQGIVDAFKSHFGTL